MAPGSHVRIQTAIKNKVLRDAKCGKCTKIVRNGILCEKCDKWFHFSKCCDIDEDKIPISEWLCATCLANDVATSDTTNESRNEQCKEDSSEWDRLITTLQEEIASLKEIIRILQEELKQVKQCNENISSWSEIVKKNGRGRAAQWNKTTALPLKHQQSKKIKQYHGKVELYTDSHGRGLSVNLCDSLRDLSVIGNIKPGACMDSVLKDCEKNSFNLSTNDAVVLFGGSNDVSKNKGQNVSDVLKQKLPNLTRTNVIVIDIPMRHDLCSWSCVNKEVKSTNVKIREVCKHFKNVTLVSTTDFDRNMFSKHGQHLNREGKTMLTAKISDVISKVTKKRECIPLMYYNNQGN